MNKQPDKKIKEQTDEAEAEQAGIQPKTTLYYGCNVKGNFGLIYQFG